MISSEVEWFRVMSSIFIPIADSAAEGGWTFEWKADPGAERYCFDDVYLELNQIRMQSNVLFSHKKTATAKRLCLLTIVYKPKDLRLVDYSDIASISLSANSSLFPEHGTCRALHMLLSVPTEWRHVLARSDPLQPLDWLSNRIIK